jgi:hypothetical protein
MTRLAAALVLVGTVAVRAQAPATSTIRGRVIAAETGLPLPNAHVSVVSSSPAADAVQDPVLTDIDGRFQLTNLVAGRFTVSAAKAGYVSARFGAGTPFDRAVDVAAQGATIEGIDFHLVKSSAISGRIVDDLGDPAVGVSVSAARMLRVDGTNRLSRVKSTTTDDLGEYRLGGLPAGRFIVSVGGGGGAATRWTPGFFPGTPSLSRAQPIAVSAGEDVGARDFVAPPAGTGTARLARLSGTVVDAQGSAVSGTIALSQVSDLIEARFGSSQPLRPGGDFSFTLGPGDYVLLARGSTGQGSAPLRVTVGDTDIAGLRLTLGRGGSITGRLVFDGTNPPKPSAVQIEAWSPDVDATAQSLLAGPRSSNGPTSGVSFNGDVFSISSLFGTHELRVRTLPPGWALKRITHETRDIEDVPLDFEDGRAITGVEIVLTDHPAQVTGVVTDEDGQDVRDYSVLLFPEDRTRVRHPSRAARWVRPDHTGRFVIDGLRGGSYLTIAVERVDDTTWADQEYLEGFRSRATRVTLADGEKKAVTLKRISRP